MTSAALPMYRPTQPTFSSLVIKKKGDFESLLLGFSRLRAVTYVASPDLLLSLFDAKGFETVEIILGENLTGSYKDHLARKGIEVTDRLARLVETGRLQVHVPTLANRSIHTKLYVLEKPGRTRLIQASANLTETAYNASRQTNYAWFVDLPPEDPWAIAVLRDYAMHLSGCSLFMGDLLELFQRDSEDRQEIIQAWLRGRASEDEESEVARVFQEMSRQVLLEPNVFEDPIISVQLPKEDHSRKQMEKSLLPLNPVISNGEAIVQGMTYIRHVNETTGLPLLRVDYESGSVKLALNGSVKVCTQPLPEPFLVSQALQHIEDYLNTVDRAETTDADFAKTAMFEALLYILWSPFATSYMTAKRDRYGSIESRGPRFLYLYGPAQNGKTTFLRFALKLLTGSYIEPLTAGDFAKTRIRSASAVGTAFPLAFDDLSPTRDKKFEDIIKNYWETWWHQGYLFPQLVISSNTESLPEWAKSRVKYVDFDVHFAPKDRDKQQLNEIFSMRNEVFTWFSWLYLQESPQVEVSSDDELYLARRCMQLLYEHAGRAMPSFFPNQPLEKLFDPGRKRWRDILYVYKKAKVRAEGRQTLVDFNAEMEQREVKQYQGHLPQTVKSAIKGKTIVIDSPKVFDSWLHGERGRMKTTLARRLLSPFRRTASR